MKKNNSKDERVQSDNASLSGEDFIINDSSSSFAQDTKSLINELDREAQTDVTKETNKIFLQDDIEQLQYEINFLRNEISKIDQDVKDIIEYCKTTGTENPGVIKIYKNLKGRKEASNIKMENLTSELEDKNDDLIRLDDPFHKRIFESKMATQKPKTNKSKKGTKKYTNLVPSINKASKNGAKKYINLVPSTNKAKKKNLNPFSEQRHYRINTGIPTATKGNTRDKIAGLPF